MHAVTPAQTDRIPSIYALHCTKHIKTTLVCLHAKPEKQTQK